MPIHDWTRVRANRFHHFHQDWTIELARALNRGILPDGFLALAEQIASGPEPDVVTLSLPKGASRNGPVGVAVEDNAPKVRFRTESDAVLYARKANRVVVHHPDGDVVAVIEIVSPGNKDSRHAIKSFVRKAVAFLHAGVNLLIVDLFPKSKRDPQGIHQVIWDRIRDEPFELPTDKPLTAVAYSAGGKITAYIEPLAVGDRLPEMPIFLSADRYVPCPLESTYQTSWDAFPKELKGPLIGPTS